MTTITIPKNFISNDDLIIVPRLEYQNLLKHVIMDDEESLWNNASKENFLKSYDNSDSVYDQI